MAKICSGISDNLLVASVLCVAYLLLIFKTCVMRAWNMVDKGSAVFLAPAMNTAMWLHPVTEDQTSKLKKFGYHVINPIEKKLACGDTGTENNCSISC